MTHTTAERPRKHRVLKVVLPAAILALAIGAAAVLLATRPSAGRAQPQAKAALVKEQPATRQDKAATFEVMGTVTAARETELKARVSGHVLSLGGAFAPGGLLRKGQTALRLDDADYRLAVRQAESAVVTAKADLDLELGQQRVAEAQLEMLKEAAGTVDGDTSLALRKPQLAQARAALEDAEASLEQARLNLARTTVSAPFNALVTERSVNLGAQVSTSDALGTLVDTDEYWVQAAVPVERLHWMRFSGGDGPGSPAEIIARSQPDPRSGHVLRVTGALAESSRMALVLISVPDPLGLAGGEPPLLLDEYVTVRITGRVIPDVVPLPRSALREDAKVWIDQNGKLDIRPVAVAWRERDTVYLSSGVEPGEMIVLTDISGATQGMALRVQDGAGASGGEAATATGAGHEG